MLSYVIFFICLLIIYLSGVSLGIGIQMRRSDKELYEYIEALNAMNKALNDLVTPIEETENGDDKNSTNLDSD